MTARVVMADGSDPAELIRRAEADSTVGNSVKAGFPVQVTAG